MSLNQIANISNAIPILQQERSEITTNPFIPNTQKIRELEELDRDANQIIEAEYNKNKTTSVVNLSIREINKNVSSSVIALLDDLFKKPNDIPWRIYLPIIIQKDQRYTYIGILFIIVAIYMLMVK